MANLIRRDIYISRRDTLRRDLFVGQESSVLEDRRNIQKQVKKIIKESIQMGRYGRVAR